MKNMQNNFQCADIYKTNKKIRIEQDSALPDYCSDVMRVLRTESMPTITSKKVYLRDSTLFCDIEGSVLFNVIYLSDDSEMESYSFKTDFFDTIKADVKELDDDSLMAFVTVNSDGASCKVQAPRRISVKTDVNLGVDVKANCEFKSYCDDDKSVEKRTREAYMTKINSAKDAEFKVSEEIKLPKSLPEIQKVLSARLDLALENTSVGDNNLNFWGNAGIHCLYQPDEESEMGVQSFYQPLEIKGSVEFDDARGDMFAVVNLAPSSLEYEIISDSLGENRILKVNFGYTAECCLKENQKIDLTEDVYGIGCKANPQLEKKEFKKYVGHLRESTAIKEKLSLKKDVKSVEGVDAKLNLIDTYFEDGELFANCRITISAIGFDDVMPFPISESFDVAIHLNLPAEVSAMSDALSFDIVQSAGYVDARAEGSRLAVAFDIDTQSDMYYNEVISFVSDVELQNIEEADTSLVFYYPSDEDTLWDIGKRYSVSIEALTTLNSISETGELKRVMMIKR